MAEWEAYYSIEPWGYKVWQHWVGLLASVIANFSMATKKHNWTAQDFTERPKTMGQQILDFFKGFGARRA